jgi:hypothetical protein
MTLQMGSSPLIKIQGGFMVRRIEKHVTPTTTHTTQVQKKSNELVALKKMTNNFMMKKGFGLLGAGRPATVSDHPPSKSSKRVSQAVNTVFPQSTKRKK